MSIIQERDAAFVAGTYARFPVEIVSGHGSVAIDSAGKEYIDLGSGIGVTAFGYSDAQWIGAVTAQLTQVQHTSNLYYTEPCGKLAEALCARTGLKKVFFSNSGAEANECAIKAARKYAADKYGPSHHVIVTLENSFHGRTLTTLAATGQEKFHKLFQPLTPGFVHTPADDFDALEGLCEVVHPAAVMIECVQGEGGVLPLDPAFVKSLAEYCERRDVLLIVDEVQTGNGRTGTLYAYQQYGVLPDIVTTAKGLGGGLPIGATLLGEKVQDVLGKGDHGSTFGGNPVACAGAFNVLSRIDDGLLAEVREKSKMVFSMLDGAPGVTGVSGMGLMIGVTTVAPASEIIAECLERGVLLLSAKEKVRLLPALNIPSELLKKAVGILLSICAAHAE